MLAPVRKAWEQHPQSLAHHTPNFTRFFDGHSLFQCWYSDSLNSVCSHLSPLQLYRTNDVLKRLTWRLSTRKSDTCYRFALTCTWHERWLNAPLPGWQDITGGGGVLDGRRYLSLRWLWVRFAWTFRCHWWLIASGYALTLLIWNSGFRTEKVTELGWPWTSEEETAKGKLFYSVVE